MAVTVLSISPADLDQFQKNVYQQDSLVISDVFAQSLINRIRDLEKQLGVSSQSRRIRTDEERYAYIVRRAGFATARLRQAKTTGEKEHASRWASLWMMATGLRPFRNFRN